MTYSSREMRLARDGRTYVFRWKPGQEHKLILRFAAMAEDPGERFDWFDAATLSYCLGRQLFAELAGAAKV